MRKYLRADTSLTYMRGIVEELPVQTDISHSAFLSSVKSQIGRSMVEMLAVLAIIGVLSVAGIVGIQYGLRKVKTNNYLESLSLLRASILGQETLSVDEYNRLSRSFINELHVPSDIIYDTPYLCGDDEFAMPLQDVPKGNCQDLLASMSGFGCRMIVNQEDDECMEDPAPECRDGNNAVAVICNLDMALGDYEAGDGDENTEVGDNTSVCPGGGYWDGTQCDTCANHCGDHGQCINGACQQCDEYCAAAGGCCHNNKCEGCFCSEKSENLLRFEECTENAGGSYCEAVSTMDDYGKICYRLTECPCDECVNGECRNLEEVYSNCAQIGNYNWDACVAHAPNGYCEEKSPAPNGEMCYDAREECAAYCPFGCLNGTCLPSPCQEIDNTYLTWGACTAAASDMYYCSTVTNAPNGDSCYVLDSCANHCSNGCNFGKCI